MRRPSGRHQDGMTAGEDLFRGRSKMWPATVALGTVLRRSLSTPARSSSGKPSRAPAAGSRPVRGSSDRACIAVHRDVRGLPDSSHLAPQDRRPLLGHLHLRIPGATGDHRDHPHREPSDGVRARNADHAESGVCVVAKDRTARAAPKTPAAGDCNGRDHIRRRWVETYVASRRGIIGSSNEGSRRAPSSRREIQPRS